jgi:hypothetical protein
VGAAWLVWFLALLSCAFGAACTSPTPYYGEIPPALPALDETYRPALEQDLAEKIAASGIKEVVLVEASGGHQVIPVGGRTPAFEQLPIVALEAATYGATKEARGAEFDLLVRRADVSPGVIVTVRHNLDGRLVVLPGNAPVVLDGPAPSAAEMQREFGIGPLLDGQVAWTADERRMLETSLRLMTPAELAYLRDLPFRREAGGEGDTHAGFYVMEENWDHGLIILMNRAFEFDETSFVGTPQRAYPLSISVILHEIGHAVAKLDRETLLRIYERDSLAYNEAVPVANEFVDALNQRYAIVNRLGPAQRRRLQKDIRLLERKHRKNGALMREARNRLKRIERQIQRPSPMEDAYGELPGARQGPTRYGSTNVEEGFADAFALYHLDPDSIRRFSLEVHDWFAAGQHLSAARYPPLEAVASPSTLVSPSDPSTPTP